MSFINMYANDVWSDADIVHHTEQMLHSRVSKEAELILSRKMIGFSLGLIIPTAEEQVELTLYQLAAAEAQQAGIEARADMVLLQAVLDYEAAQARLLVAPVTEPEEAVLVDTQECAAAQTTVDTADNNVVSIALLRQPITVVDVSSSLTA